MATHAATLLASLAPHRRHSTPTPSSNAASASTTTRRSIAPAVPSSRRHHRSSIIANGIGFQLNDKDDDSSRGDLEATALIEDASSILYLQEPLRHPCAQAYLALLQQISLKAGPNKLFVAYGEFFRSLRRSGRSTFADVILDEVIVGRGNPVASDIANGSTPNDVDIAAVGADLELLQRICVSEATVLKWCQRLASSASPARKQPGSWVAAAEGLGVKAEGAEGGAEEGADGADSDSNGGEFDQDSGFMAPPATRTQIAKLRDAVADSWKWSDSLSGVLCDHWRVHGVGEPAIGSVLTWHSPKRGATADVDRDGDAEIVGAAWHSTPRTEDEVKVRDELIAHFTAFANGDDTKGHVLVHGDAGRGKRWVLRSALGQCLGSGVRVVQIPREALRNLPDVCENLCKEHPKTRFVLLLDMPLALTPYAEFHNELTSVMDGGGGGKWPANAMLAAPALKPTALKPDVPLDDDSLACRFDLSLGI